MQKIADNMFALGKIQIVRYSWYEGWGMGKGVKLKVRQWEYKGLVG